MKKINLRNTILFILCIFINLLIGNIALLLMLPDLPVIYHVLISLGILIIYGIAFYKSGLQNKEYTKWQLAGIAVLLSLLGMMIACIFTSIGIRLPMDNMITAAIKGIIPMFIFAIVFASPFWIPLAIVNFVCLNYVKRPEK